MTEFWSAIVSGAIGAVVAALLIGLLRELVERLSPFTVVTGSTAVGFVLVGLGWAFRSNELLVAGVGVVVAGLLGAWYMALSARGEPSKVTRH